jgi:hypothetical protein
MLAIQKGTSSALRHLKKDRKIGKQGRRIRTDQMAIMEAAAIATQAVAQVVTRFNANTCHNYRIWLWAYPGPWAIHGPGRLFWLAHEGPGPSATGRA